MIKVSELIGKQVIALSTAESVGTVDNIIFDSKLSTAKYLKIFSDGDTEPETGYLDFKRITCFAFDALTVADRSAVKYEWNASLAGAPNPVNAACYNQDGKFLGTVRDVYMEGCTVKSIMTDLLKLDPASVLSGSEQMLIFNETGKALKIARKKPAVPKKASGINVKIHAKKESFLDSIAPVMPQKPPEPPKESAPEPAAQPALTNKDIGYPVRVPPENTSVSRSPAENNGGSIYAFLVGKKLSRPLKDDGGKILIEAQTVIDESVISSARQFGKLVQLALYAD